MITHGSTTPGTVLQIPGQVPPGFEQVVGHFRVGVGTSVGVSDAVGVGPPVGVGLGVGVVEAVGVAVEPPVVGAAGTGTSSGSPAAAGVGAINDGVGVGDGV